MSLHWSAILAIFGLIFYAISWTIWNRRKVLQTSIELFQDFKKSPVIFIIGVIAFIIFGAVIILTSLLMINTLNTIADGKD